MKRNIVYGVFSALIVTLMFSCSSKKEEGSETAAPVVDKEQIKKEIQAKEDEFANAYNTGSKDSIGYYAEDATTFAQNRPPIVGKKAIVEYLYASVDSNSRSNKISFTTNEVFPSSDGNQVLEIGYYKVIDSTNTAVNTGNYMTLFEKRDGKYRSVRDMSASDMPLQ